MDNIDISTMVKEYIEEKHEERFETVISNLLENKIQITTIDAIINLVKNFGRDMTLGKLLDETLKIYPHQCPNCKGKGYITREYNGYPSGLPDSGFVYEAAYEDIPCELCKGIGYTKKHFVPNMVQQGWKTEE